MLMRLYQCNAPFARKVMLPCRERQRQKLEALQKRRTDYAQTVDDLHSANHENKQLEAENQKLEEKIQQLSTSDGISYIQPSAPSSASENGYSGESDNSSTSPNVFPTRVGSHIPATAAQKSAYQETEQAWFAKASSVFSTVPPHMHATLSAYTMSQSLSICRKQVTDSHVNF